MSVLQIKTRQIYPLYPSCVNICKTTFHKNDIRFVFTFSCLYDGSCLIYFCVCLRIVVSNTYCVAFLYCFSSSCLYPILPVSLCFSSSCVYPILPVSLCFSSSCLYPILPVSLDYSFFIVPSVFSYVYFP